MQKKQSTVAWAPDSSCRSVVEASSDEVILHQVAGHGHEAADGTGKILDQIVEVRGHVDQRTAAAFRGSCRRAPSIRGYQHDNWARK